MIDRGLYLSGFFITAIFLTLIVASFSWDWTTETHYNQLIETNSFRGLKFIYYPIVFSGLLVGLRLFFRAFKDIKNTKNQIVPITDIKDREILIKEAIKASGKYSENNYVLLRDMIRNMQPFYEIEILTHKYPFSKSWLVSGLIDVLKEFNQIGVYPKELPIYVNEYNEYFKIDEQSLKSEPAYIEFSSHMTF